MITFLITTGILVAAYVVFVLGFKAGQVRIR